MSGPKLLALTALGYFVGAVVLIVVISAALPLGRHIGCVIEHAVDAPETYGHVGSCHVAPVTP